MLRPLRILQLASLAWAASAHAQVEGSNSAPVMPATAPAPTWTPCPGTLELDARLRSLLEESACGVPERQLLVSLRRGESVSGTLVVLHDYQAEYVREVSGPTCAEVESALTLALEIYLDPGETGNAACAPKATPRAGGKGDSPDWPGQDLDPFNLPAEPKPPPLPTVVEPQPSGVVRAVFQIDSSYTPKVAFGVAAAVRVRLTPQNFLGITLSQQIAPPFQSAAGSTVQVSATALGIAFGQHLPLGNTAEFSLEAGPRLGLLETGTGQDVAWTFAGTAALQLTASLGVRIARGLGAGVQAGGVFNVVRARYLDGDQELAWEQPWTGGYLGLYFGAAVPGPARRPSRPGAGL